MHHYTHSYCQIFRMIRMLPISQYFCMSLLSSLFYQVIFMFFFMSSRRRHTRWPRDWSSDVCSSDLDLPALNMYLWIQFAVFLHVFVDMFNSYGTPALRPINNTWIQLGVINTVDIPIITMHVLYFILWFLCSSPVWLCFILYAFILTYYLARASMTQFIHRIVYLLLADPPLFRMAARRRHPKLILRRQKIPRKHHLLRPLQ